MALATRSDRARRRPRLRTVLLVVNLLILLLPFGGIAALRLYENELVRGTEAQLLVQGAFVREAFRAAYRRAAGMDETYLPPAPRAAEERALLPLLEVSGEKILPPAPPGVPATGADPTAARAGTLILPVLAAAGETLAGIRVVDANGVVVATTGAEGGLSLAQREEVAWALQGAQVSLLRQRVTDQPRPALQSLSRGQLYRVFVALPVEDQGRVIGAVVLSRTPLDIMKALYLNRWPLVVGSAGVLLVVVLVSTLTALTIVRPARVLIEQADRVARGERGAVVALAEPGTHEMARLSEAISHMARTLEQRAEYIRTFASHISHEFKTPLTTIRGTLELLRDHGSAMTSVERDRFMTILEESSGRLELLLRRLLELARADVQAPGDERTDVTAALARIAQRHREAGLDVVTESAADVGSIHMAPETFAELLSNMLDNARLHGGPGVRVRLAARLDRACSPPVVELIVADSGAGISEANAGRIFTPFFTTAREKGGSGLGLSIVRALVEAHRGSIRLVERTGSGAMFLLRLPAAAE